MWTLRELYHSIPLAEWNPTQSVPTLSDRWFKGYPYLCTLVLRQVLSNCYLLSAHVFQTSFNKYIPILVSK